MAERPDSRKRGAAAAALGWVRRLLDIPEEKMVVHMRDTGNLVSASIPVALKRALDGGRIQANDLVVLCGFGVGLSWGTMLIRMPS